MTYIHQDRYGRFHVLATTTHERNDTLCSILDKLGLGHWGSGFDRKEDAITAEGEASKLMRAALNERN